MTTTRWLGLGITLLAPALWLPATAMADTLEAIQERDSVRCGVNAAQPGFSSLDDNDQYRGLDTDRIHHCDHVPSARLRRQGRR